MGWGIPPQPVQAYWTAEAYRCEAYLKDLVIAQLYGYAWLCEQQRILADKC